MKLNFFFFIFLNFSAFGQISFTVPSWYNDVLSESKYDLIIRRNRELTARHSIRTSYLKILEKEYEERNNELKRVSDGVKNLGDDLKNFINYDSNSIISEKYPIFSVTKGPDLHNALKRDKYRKKFTKYTEYTNKTLNVKNPLSEAKRTLLLLQIMEEVVNSTVKTEKKYDKI